MEYYYFYVIARMFLRTTIVEDSDWFGVPADCTTNEGQSANFP